MFKIIRGLEAYIAEIQCVREDLSFKEWRCKHTRTHTRTHAHTHARTHTHTVCILSPDQLCSLTSTEKEGILLCTHLLSPTKNEMLHQNTVCAQMDLH